MATKTQILISARDGASAVFGKVARSSTGAQKRIFGVNNALQSTDKSMKALSSSAKGLAAGAAGVFGLGALAASLKDAVAVKIEYDKINNVLKAVTGSSSKAAAEFKFLSEESERLGIQLRPLAQSYTRLSAAGQLLGLSTKETREIFTSFSEALTGFGATREQSIRVFTAIEQILSKGKVSAEELRQQLGEALPGSFQLAAKAAGVTVQELDGMLKRGELLSSEFILPFAKAVRTQFGGAAVEGAKLLNAEFSRTINVLDKVKLAIVEGTKPGDSLANTLARIIKSFREFIGNEERLNRFAEAGRALGTGLELAAKSIQTIANVISKIPSEALIALGAIAVGKSLKTASAVSSNLATIALGGVRTQNAVSAATTAPRGAFDIIRDQRNFLPSVSAGQLSGGTSGYIRGMLSGRTEWGDAKESERRARRDAWRRASSRPRSKYNTDVSYRGPDNITQLGPVLSQLTGQKKIAEGFEKTFVPAVEKSRNTLKEFGSALATGTKSLVDMVGPLTIITGGLAGWASVIDFYSKASRDKEFFEGKSRATDLESVAAVAFSQVKARSLAGETLSREQENEILNKQLERAGAFEGVAKGGLTVEQINKIREAFDQLFEGADKLAEKVKEVVDPTRAVVEAFSGGTTAIKQYAADVNKLGVERATELKNIREIVAALDKKDITEKEALQLAKERIAAQKEANKAEEAEAARKKKVKESAEAAKKAATSLRDFNKETKNIQKENAARARGVSEEAIESARRQREYQEALEASGVATEQATKAARDRVAAENEKAKAEKQKQILDGVGATGRALSALSGASRLKDQERANKRLVLEQIKAQKAAAAKKQREEKKQKQDKKKEDQETKKNTTDMKEALTDIRDILNSYNTSFA